MEQKTFTHKNELYFGEYSFTTDKTSPFNAELDVTYITYEQLFLNEDKVERIIKFINGFIEKNYKNKNKYITIRENEKYLNIVIVANKGCDSLNEWITKFMRELDLYLYYFNMPLTRLGTHFHIIKDIIREQHQFHWLNEEVNYDNLILKD